MSGVLLTGHGGPEVLVWSDTIPLPRPGPGEVLVRVLAAGVNATDINTRTGWYAAAVTGPAGAAIGRDGGWSGAIAFPRIQGGDLCGRIVALGPGVAGLAPGMRVTCPINQPEPSPGDPRRMVALGSDYDGAFAQYACIPARHLRDVTDAPLTDVEIAAMPCAFGTALNLLTRAGVVAGEAVLVTGAAGGVGLAAVAIATLLGARVTGLAGADREGAVRAAGAAEVMARDAALPAGGFDAVIDIVGGPRWGGLIAALRPGGRLAVAGAIAGPMVALDLRTLYLCDITLYGCTRQPAEVFDRLTGWMRAGALRPRIARVYPLAEIARAQADFLAGGAAGKLVLIPPEAAS